MEKQQRLGLIGERDGKRWMLAVLFASVCLVQASLAIPPHWAVSTNSLAEVTSPHPSILAPYAWSESRWAITPPSFKLQMHVLWWEVQDYARYGVPYLIKNDRGIAVCCGFLLILLSSVICRSISRTWKVRVNIGGGETISETGPQEETSHAAGGREDHAGHATGHRRSVLKQLTLLLHFM